MGFLLLIWIVMGVLCAGVALSKGRSAIGWLILGFLFGPLALLFAAAMSPVQKQTPAHHCRTCPFCAEKIQVRAISCKRCGKVLQEPLSTSPMKDQWEIEFAKKSEQTEKLR